MTDENFEDTHWGRTELQYFYIPKLVDAVNNGYLPSTALHGHMLQLSRAEADSGGLVWSRADK